MKRVLNFLKRWGVLIGAVLLVILGFVVGGAFTRKLRQPVAKVKRELDVMKAGTEAAAVAVEKNAETAIALIEEQEKETLNALDDARSAKYAKVRASGDAELVARHLRRLADPARREGYRRAGG